MITIQEQLSNFEMKCENTFDKRKQKTPAGIKVPIPALEDVFVEFRAGERYLFGGEWGVSYLRNLLLWQLAKQGSCIYITSSRLHFEMDFLDLLQKESGVPSWHIANGCFGKGEQRSILEALERIRSWNVTWLEAREMGECTDVAEKPYFHFSYIQKNDIFRLKSDKNAVNFFFVQGNIPPYRKEDFCCCHNTLRFSNTIAEYFCYSQSYVNPGNQQLVNVLLRDTNRLKKRDGAILLDGLGRSMGSAICEAEDIV